MRKVLKNEGIEKEKKETSANREDWKPIQTRKQSYHKGWCWTMISVWPWTEAHKTHLLTCGKVCLGLHLLRVEAGSQQHPFSLHIPDSLPAKQCPVQRIPAQCRERASPPQPRNPCFSGTEFLSLSWTIKAPLHIHLLGQQAIPLLSPVTQFYGTYSAFETVWTLRNMTERGHLVKKCPKAREGSGRHKDTEISKDYILKNQLKWIKVANAREQDVQILKLHCKHQHKPHSCWFTLDFGWQCPHCCYSPE